MSQRRPKPVAPEHEDFARMGKALIRQAPERMLWTGNLPHPSAPADHKPDDADLLDLLLNWAPDDATRRKFQVNNPVELFGLPKA